jgi:tetratricopeptide (TPR) repeat protein
VLQVAERYWDFGSMEPACEKYEYVLNNYPGYDRACWIKMRLVMAHIKRSDLETAETKLAELLTEFAGSDQLAPAVHEIVEEYRNSGANEQGRELFAYILDNWTQDDRTNLELQVGLALQSIKLKDETKTYAAVERLIADFNDHPNIGKGLFQVAEEHFYAKNYWETIELLELIQNKYSKRIFPARGEVPFVLATCYQRVSEVDKAIENYERMLKEYPRGKFASRTPYCLGFVYANMKIDYAKAIYWFECQRENYPNDAYSELVLSDMCLIYSKRLGDYTKGTEVCQQYVDFYPKGADLWGCLSNLAWCYEKLGENDKAIEVLFQAFDKARSEAVRESVFQRIDRLTVKGLENETEK